MAPAALLLLGCPLDDRDVTPAQEQPSLLAAPPDGGVKPGDGMMGDGGSGVRDGAEALPPSLGLAPCTPGSGFCTSSTEWVECAGAGVWSSPVTCDYACSERGCSGECRPGEGRCASTTQRQECSPAGEWSAAEVCENACVAGVCGGACVPGAQRCDSESDVQICSDAGEWGPSIPCPLGCSGGGCAGECTVGATECFSESQLRLCSDAGRWQTPVTCPLACRAGQCSGDCVPGAIRCNPESGAPQRCDESGLWRDAPVCAPGAACPATALAQCGEVCTSLQNDPEHCGSCGISCEGGDCVAGRCRPVVLGSGFARPSSVALSDTHVYFRDGDTPTSDRFMRIPKGGGPAEVVVVAPGDLSSPVIGGNQLYFVVDGASGGRVRRANLDGSGALDFSPLHPEGIPRLIVPGFFVYYTVRDATSTTVFRAPLLSAGQSGAGTESPFETAPGPLPSMTVVSGCLYYVDAGTPRQLSRKCASADPPLARYTGLGELRFQSSEANDGTFLYFVDAGRGLMRVPLESTGGAELLATGIVEAPTVAEDALYYFAETGGPSAPGCSTANALLEASKVPAGGPPVRLLSPPLPCPTRVAADDRALYWTTASGDVLRLSR